MTVGPAEGRRVADDAAAEVPRSPATPPVPAARAGRSRSSRHDPVTGRVDTARRMYADHRHRSPESGGDAGSAVTVLPRLAPGRPAPLRGRRGAERPGLGVRDRRQRRPAPDVSVRRRPAVIIPATWPSTPRARLWSARTTGPAAWRCIRPAGRLAGAPIGSWCSTAVPDRPGAADRARTRTWSTSSATPCCWRSISGMDGVAAYRWTRRPGGCARPPRRSRAGRVRARGTWWCCRKSGGPRR